MARHIVTKVTKPGVEVSVDRFNNVFVTKRNGNDPLPCVAAHIDNVQSSAPIHVIADSNVIFGVTKDMRYQAGLGADDKTGVQVCLELLERFDHIKLALFASEEIGCVGSYGAAPSEFTDVGYVIEFDCPSRNMMSYTSGGERLFDNDGEFIKTAAPTLFKHGTTLWQHHPFTDVMAIRKRFPISCLNLSSGYYNWHASNEFVKIDEVDMAIELGADLIKTLGPTRYACLRVLSETAPAVPVGHLKVPKP